MEVGDYVRTVGGFIGEVISKKGRCTTYRIPNMQEDDVLEIIKSSPNIIDLFEEHDLVVIEYYSLRYKERVARLFEVDYKDEEFITLKNAYCDFMLRNNKFNDEDKKLKPIIKSIVTHEQFESMQYNLESQV